MSIVSAEEREKHFGHWNHLRIFGNDFANIVEQKGFKVITVNKDAFTNETVKKHTLFPTQLSSHPLATNYRKVFFCKKSKPIASAT